MIKELTADHEIQEALTLIEDVFSQFEAPDYSAKGVQEFQAYIAFDAVKQRIHLQELTLWGDFQEKKIVGVIGIRPVAHISLLFVEAAWHRQGVARKLYRTVRELVGEQTITVNSSPYAVPAYQRLGFEATAEEQLVNGIRFIPMAHSKKNKA